MRRRSARRPDAVAARRGLPSISGGTASSLRKTMSSLRETMPSFRETMSSLRETMPSFRETMSSFRETKSSLRETMPSFRETMSSFRETMSSFRETMSSLRETMSFFRETMSSLRETISSRQATTPSLQETMSSFRETKPSLQATMLQVDTRAYRVADIVRRPGALLFHCAATLPQRKSSPVPSGESLRICCCPRCGSEGSGGTRALRRPGHGVCERRFIDGPSLPREFLITRELR
jgi:prefoldin subunit 5